MESFGDAGQGAAVEVEGVNVADEFGLLLVDDEVAVGTSVVAEEPNEGDGDSPVREPFPVPSGDVLADGAGFLLREAGHDGDGHFNSLVEFPADFWDDMSTRLLNTWEHALSRILRKQRSPKTCLTHSSTKD